MTIDEKIKQAAEDLSKYETTHADTRKYIKEYFLTGAKFAKSEMLADMQKLVEALEYCAENADPDDEAALVQKFLCMRAACRIALAEFKQKYQGEK